MTYRLLALALVPGCSLFQPKVPSQIQGDIPVVIVNNVQYDMCHFALIPVDVAKPDGWMADWLHGNAVKFGKPQTVKVKAGTYRVETSTCAVSVEENGRTLTDYADGVLGPVVVTGPIYVDFAPQPSAAPSGYTYVYVRPVPHRE
jgi:hypothetical protein